MKVQKFIKELEDNSIISSEVAEDIYSYYHDKKTGVPKKLVFAFSILGSVLVSTGIILLIAHNWDDFNRPTKLIVSFFPMLIGQGLCTYSLIWKNNSPAWKEASSSFLFLSIGATLSLISQIYNIYADIEKLLLLWILLGSPLMYLMRSSMISLFHIIMITVFAISATVNENLMLSYLYWPFLVFLFPHYYHLIKKQGNKGFYIFLTWLIPISVLALLTTMVIDEEGIIIALSYISFLTLVSILGKTILKNKNINGFLTLSYLGINISLMVFSFFIVWDELETDIYDVEYFNTFIILFGSIVASIVVAAIKRKKLIQYGSIHDAAIVIFILAILCNAMSPILSTLLINAAILAMATFTIKRGLTLNKLLISNAGFLLISSLIICRFFDMDISYTVRGIGFIIIGAGFFVSNYFFIKKKKQNETVLQEK